MPVAMRLSLAGFSVVALCLSVSLPPAATAAPSVPWTVETSGMEFVTPATQSAVNRGLEYLAASQHEDGSFGSTTMYRQNVAVTALAGIAFLSAGNTPGRGRYGKCVDKAVNFILASTHASGFINVESMEHGPMYGHGFATLFLAEAYGMTRRAEIREKLKLAVNLIINTQNKEGGWRYQPVRKEADPR